MSKPLPYCFVISPIGVPGSKERLHADMVLGSIIEPAMSEEYLVHRADASAGPEMINERIIERILNAELAIADLTFHNPNVFYELGLRHMKEKPVILIQQEGTPRAFDVSSVNTIDYRVEDYHSHKATRDRIRSAAAEVMSKPRVSNPVTSALGSLQIQNSADSRDDLVLAMTKQLSEMQQRLDRIDVETNGDFPRITRPSRNALLDMEDSWGNRYMRDQAERRARVLEDAAAAARAYEITQSQRPKG